LFADTDEEIVFIIDKIKQAGTKNVVLIVPDRASIFITSASLKLLKSAIDKLDKYVILVTMDDYGKKMADSLGIVTAYRVREVTDELWETVVRQKYAKNHKSSYKNSSSLLIESAKPEVQTDENTDDANSFEPIHQTLPAETKEEDEHILPNIHEKFEFKNSREDHENTNVEDSFDYKSIANQPEILEDNLSEISDENIPEEKIEEQIEQHEFLRSDEENIEQELPSRQDIEENHLDIVDKEIGFKTPKFNFQKDKILEDKSDLLADFDMDNKPIQDEKPEQEKLEIDEKVYSNNDSNGQGFVFFIGQDVKELDFPTPISQKKSFKFKKEVKGNQISKELEFEEEYDEKHELESKGNFPRKKKLDKKDFDKVINFTKFILLYIFNILTYLFSYIKNLLTYLFQKFTNRSSKFNNRNSRTPSKPISKKRLYISIGVVSIFLLFMWWFVYMFSPNIRINAQVIDRAVKKQLDVTANFGATEGVIASSKTQSAKSSDSGAVTGTGKTGNSATGTVRATYIQASGTVSIKSGTSLTCSKLSDCGGTALSFITQEDHIFSVANNQQQITVKASDIGSAYNLPSGVNFKFNGISELDIITTNLQPFTGGDSKDVKIVTKDDYAQVKDRLTATLKANAFTELQKDSPNISFINDNVKVEVKTISPDENIIGKEADILNMDMEVLVTANGYDTLSVRPYVENLLKAEQKDNLFLDPSSIKITDKIKKSDSKSITITLDISAVLKVSINEDEIRTKLLGKSLSEIKPIFDSYQNLQFISYSYQPSWAPGFLQHVPFSSGATIIKVERTVQ
jgi:hypothetical protein